MKCLQKVGANVLAIVLMTSHLPVASASIVVQLESITPFFNTGNYRWSFSATATATDGFLADDNVYFTIYDLPGTIITVEAPSLPYEWGASGGLLGLTPAGLSPTDDPAIGNVTFKYKDLSEVPGNEIAGDASFDIILSTNIPVYSDFSWQDYSAYPVPNGVLQSGLGTVGQGDGLGNIPEPGTLALLSLGLAGLAASRRRTQ